MINGFRLYSDATTAVGKIGGMESPQANIDWNNPPRPVNGQGRIPARKSTRILQVQIDIPAVTAGQPAKWSALAGIDFDAGDAIADGLR
jgi:hypothetical protein